MCTKNHENQDVFLQYAVIWCAIVALCTGYFTWSFKRMVIVYAIGVFFSMMIVLPDWDFFTKRPIREWVHPMASDEESRSLQAARFSVLKNTPKYAKREDIHPLGILFVFVGFACSVYFSWKFVMS